MDRSEHQFDHKSEQVYAVGLEVEWGLVELVMALGLGLERPSGLAFSGSEWGLVRSTVQRSVHVTRHKHPAEEWKNLRVISLIFHNARAVRKNLI